MLLGGCLPHNKITLSGRLASAYPDYGQFEPRPFTSSLD